MAGSASIVRTGATANPGFCAASIDINAGMRVFTIWLYNGVLGAVSPLGMVAQCAILVAGDVLRGSTQDASVGGTCQHDLHANVMEFDK